MTKSAIFPHFFDPHRIGQNLKEVSSDLLRVESRDLVGRWFHAQDEIDLFIWSDEKKKIVKQQLTFYGQVVEWNVIEGTKTGVIIEDESPPNSSGQPVKAAETIRFDERAHPQPIGLAMAVIRHTGALSEDERKQIVANYFRGQKRSSLNPSEFLELYAQWNEPEPGRLARFARRIIKALRWLIKPL